MINLAIRPDLTDADSEADQMYKIDQIIHYTTLMIYMYLTVFAREAVGNDFDPPSVVSQPFSPCSENQLHHLKKGGREGGREWDGG